MPDTWRCECGYTNMNSKTCLGCRRPRHAVPPSLPTPVDDKPVAAEEEPPKRPLKARSTTKKAPSARKRDKKGPAANRRRYVPFGRVATARAGLDARR